MSSILTSASSGDERRQVERKPLCVRVMLVGKPEMEVRSVDVRTGGMSLVADVNLAPATSCNLSFTLPLPDGSMHRSRWPPPSPTAPTAASAVDSSSACSSKALQGI